MIYQAEHLNIMHDLVGKRLIHISYQPAARIKAEYNLFVIDFGRNKSEYSLRPFCFVRFRDNKQILLMSTDRYFTPAYTHLSDDEYSGQECFEKSLIPIRIKNVKQLLKSAKVERVEVQAWGDIHIYFNNGIVLEVSIDCSYEGYEYYRVIDVLQKIHYIVTFEKGDLEITVMK